MTKQNKKTADEWMLTPISQWPESLRMTVVNAGKRWGSSGDVIYECIQAWIKGGEIELSAAQMQAKDEATQ